MATKIEIGNETMVLACRAFAGRAPEDEPYYDNIIVALEAVAPLLIVQGMERAADIAEDSHGSRNAIYEKSRRDAASAIRSAAKEV